MGSRMGFQNGVQNGVQKGFQKGFQEGVGSAFCTVPDRRGDFEIPLNHFMLQVAKEGEVQCT